MNVTTTDRTQTTTANSSTRGGAGASTPPTIRTSDSNPGSDWGRPVLILIDEQDGTAVVRLVFRDGSIQTRPFETVDEAFAFTESEPYRQVEAYVNGCPTGALGAIEPEPFEALAS